MRCPACNFEVPYRAEGRNLENCPVCPNVRLVPTSNDVLEHRYKDVVREVRPTQVALARAIDDAFISDANYTVMVEGGTGIGKSFSYLLPSLLGTTKRVVIATAKKTLQDQLVNKDLPYLVEKLGVDAKFCVLKGKGNYACPLLLSAGGAPKSAIPKLKMLQKKNKYIQRDDWEGEEPVWWGHISAENCPYPKNCPIHRRCRPEPKRYDIIVTNHHYLALSLLYEHVTVGGDFKTLIVDEAHQLLKAIRSMISLSIGPKRIERLIRNLVNAGPLHEVIAILGLTPKHELWEKNLKPLHKEIVKYHTFLSNNHKEGIRAYTAEYPRSAELKNAIKGLQDTYEDLSKCLDSYNRASENAPLDFDPDDVSPEEVMAGLSQLNRYTQQCSKILDTLYLIPPKAKMFHKPKDRDNWIISTDENDIHAKPIDIVPYFATTLANIDTKVFVSATLSVAKDFSYMRRSLGIERAEELLKQDEEKKDVKTIYKEFIFDSPFNYKKQALLYAPFWSEIPKTTNDEARPEWIANISKEIEQLCILSHGRAFVLFSATTDMHETYEVVTPRLNAHGLTILMQGEEGNSHLLAQFRGNPNTVLFGLESFWEGIDISGDSLQMVIIPKLPFPNPMDPVIRAESELADNAFYDIFIPRMIFTLKQGVGRLIRTQQDKGYVAILDPRVWSGTKQITRHQTKVRLTEERYKATKRLHPSGYGAQILKALGFPIILPYYALVEKYAPRYLNTSFNPD